MRLIDADDLDNVVWRLNEEGRTITRSEYKTLDSIIFEFPTIEAEPVRRGRWVEGINDKWVCSECGTGNNYAYSWDITGYQLQDRYCPNCGAKMEGD